MTDINNFNKNMVNKNIYENFMKLFLQENAKVNLISKNDEKYLWEKHIFDSISFEKFYDKYIQEKNGLKLLDIGTGGGFPAIPIAIKYPQIEVTALDSIAKKIRAVSSVSESLGLKNLHPVCKRVENLEEMFDIITSRAVSSLKNISLYALPKLKKGGYFVAYKSKKTEEEINEASPIIKNLGGKVIDIIPYKLPLKEELERNLIIISK